MKTFASDVTYPWDWLDLKRLAQIEITSGDPAHPVESALERSYMTPSYSEQIVDGTQANITTASRIAAVMTEATERLIRLQTEAAQAMFAETSRSFQTLLNQSDPAAAPSLYQANAQRMSEVSRRSIEIVWQTQAAVTQLMAQHFGAYGEATRQNLEEITETVTNLTVS